MEKKTYKKPEIEVITLNDDSIICTSDYNWDTPDIDFDLVDLG